MKKSYSITAIVDDFCESVRPSTTKFVGSLRVAGYSSVSIRFLDIFSIINLSAACGDGERGSHKRNGYLREACRDNERVSQGVISKINVHPSMNEAGEI
jgi:hypothetical protein